MIIGIDANNITAGGGITHLNGLLDSYDLILKEGGSNFNNIKKVIIWGRGATLKVIKDFTWLQKSRVDINSSLRLLLWQIFCLKRAAQKEKCSVLLIPGGAYLGRFFPVVTMCQNMLPFEWYEIRRHGWSKTSVRLIALRFIHIYSFRRSDHVIFLTEYANQIVKNIARLNSNKNSIIPHGVDSKFFILPRKTKNICMYTKENPFRLLYVSWIGPSKHHDIVAEAVLLLRNKKLPIVIDMIGACHETGKNILNKLKMIDSDAEFINYYGEVPYENLHYFYKKADLGVFASSCENLPITLLEYMSAGLPIVSSNRGPMFEILDDAGVYFDPENKNDIADSILDLIINTDKRELLAKRAYAYAQDYTWEICAKKTFEVLYNVANNKPKDR